MGGDDLDSDDEFLNPSVEDSAEVKLAEKVQREEEHAEKKRKREQEDEEEKAAKAPKKKSSYKVLIQAGRDLEKQSADEQAAFLSMSLKHYVQMKGDSIEGLVTLRRSHFLTSSEDTMAARLKSVVTMKNLKTWKPIGTSMVIIVCVSARRAVAVLKELSGMKIRAAKLFAKHMSVEEQKEMLRTESFGIAVGTPNRLQLLCEPEKGSNKAPLYLGKTSLVVLDTHANEKGFTVCTLPDTAPDTINFIKERVMPQMRTRKDIKLAFL